MNRVAVLMSTYNGEKYIRPQIQSILEQKNVEVALYVRDDGSSDNTIDIINEYSEICLIKGDNVGVGNSFMELLYSVDNEYDYYAFADQDDIWQEDKLEAAIDILKREKKHLYGSNQQLIDSENKEIGIRYPIDKNIHRSPVAIMEQNQIPGCTMVFDREFAEKLRNNRPGEAVLINRIHDTWLAIVASLDDSLYYDTNAYILYRQHANNVVGAYSYGIIYEIKQKCIKLFDKEKRNGRSMIAKELYRLWPEQVKEDPLLLKCAMYGGFKTKLELIKDRDELLKYTSETSLGITLKIMCNLF